ncbi:DUF5304 family protein [Streptomyces sp. XD-27]|uniref:DUF5304 family protein n=1 Tax=Streptomyces sp. XD-27 TaxID=3062779 RepID=UPI0026F4152E|nr:DUF5304 family protein [Streptomyces sp. XD-27]WKX69864.1 DUF5304 family protein [Streptomyces sp. XD-27]
MSDATERPHADAPQEAEPGAAAGDARITDEDPAYGVRCDDDAWQQACAEDLAAERARRRARAAGEQEQPGSAAEELRKLAEAVAEKVSALQAPIAGTAVHGAVQQLIAQAKAAVEPVIERNPDVFDHLASAGNELLAAYRAAVAGQEQRWTRGSDRSSSEHIDLD